MQWAKDSPVLDVNSDEEVSNFFDKYISASIPKDNDELKELVTSRQRHKCGTSYCTKKGTGCRFKFPKLASLRTVISRQTDMDTKNDIEEARFVQNYVWQQAISESQTEDSLSELHEILNCLGIHQDLYTQSLTKVSKKVEVIPKQNFSDVYINQYNKELLSLWKANMDIQFLQNAYSVVMYMFSYMMKKEKGMGELLKRVAEEVEQNTPTMREKLQKVGNAFMGAREFSAQEATMRVLSMPLVHKSKKVIYISGYAKDEWVKMPHWDIKNLGDDEEDIFQKSVHEFYSLCPGELENITLADFATTFQKSTRQSQEDRIHEEDHGHSNEETT